MHAICPIDEVWKEATEVVNFGEPGRHQEGDPGEVTPLVAGQYVDAFCTKTQKWYPSKILAIEADRARVHFNG